jgi:hypothetical protein
MTKIDRSPPLQPPTPAAEEAGQAQRLPKAKVSERLSEQADWNLEAGLAGVS